MKLLKKILLFIVIGWAGIGGVIFIPQFLGVLWMLSPFGLPTIYSPHILMPTVLWVEGFVNTFFLCIIPLLLVYVIYLFLMEVWRLISDYVDFGR